MRPYLLQRGDTMELEFERDTIVGYDQVAAICLCQEETLESIVPDACPDILRIVDVYGQASLLSKQAEEGMAVVNGLVRTVILYHPEEGDGLRRMEAAVPFTCRAEAAGLTDRGVVLASPRLRAAEARALNPRKVLLRVDLAVDLIACQPSQKQVCRCVNEGDDTLCQRQFQGEHTHLFSVQEKPFTFTENIRIQGIQSGAAQVLAGHCAARCTESKLIGNKLILKGAADVELLLQEPEGALSVSRETLPISQVLEVNGAGEDCICHVSVETTDFRWDSEIGEDRSLDLSLELLAQALVFVRRPVTLLQDLYSTKYQMEVECVPFALHRVEENGPRTQPVRELLETTDGIRSVVDSRVVLGPVSQSGKGGDHILTTQAQVTALYLDDRNLVQSIQKTIPVSCSFPCPEGAHCVCRCPAATDLFATPTAGGIEIRFSVDFFGRFTTESTINTVEKARTGEVRENDRQRPSVVLRLAVPGEGLWELAKAYGTTMEGIRQANDLEDESLPSGRMLLIPGCR